MKTSKFMSLAFICALFVSTFALSGCQQANSSHSSPFYGKWVFLTISYDFTDTAVTYTVPSASVPGTYTYDTTAQTITITLGSTSTTYTYVLDGNNLTLTQNKDGSSLSITYVKQ